jgi:hypothetical protein
LIPIRPNLMQFPNQLASQRKFRIRRVTRS